MFYVIGDNLVIESLYNCPTEDDLKQLANDCNLDALWVIRGEHSGITYERPQPKAEPAPTPRLVFGQSAPGNRLHHAPKHRPLSLTGAE